MDFGYGVQVNGLVGDAKLSAELADKLHARWIKQQLQWGVFEHEQGKIDWTGFDNIINAAHERGLRVMLSIPTAPQWTHPNLQPSTPPGENDPDAIEGPPDDPQAYANFVGQVVDRYKGKIQAIEVWNEQNLVREWRTTPQKIDASAYIALLSAAYKTIKEKDPNITVISGALSPTGVSDGVNAVDDFVYMQQMVDAGLLDVDRLRGRAPQRLQRRPERRRERRAEPAQSGQRQLQRPVRQQPGRSASLVVLQGYAARLQPDSARSEAPVCDRIRLGHQPGLRQFPARV